MNAHSIATENRWLVARRERDEEICLEIHRRIAARLPLDDDYPDVMDEVIDEVLEEEGIDDGEDVDRITLQFYGGA